MTRRVRRSAANPGATGTRPTFETPRRRSILVSLAACAALGLSVGCATRAASHEGAEDLGRAGTLLRDGCYRCLEEALALYDRLAARRRSVEAARLGGFRAALLLGVRAKELGLPSDDLLASARARATELESGAGTPAPLSAYIAAADQLIGETSGLDPEVRRVRTARPRTSPGDSTPELAPVRAALAAALQTDVVAAYLVLALDCEDPRQPGGARPDPTPAFARIPLLGFKLASCGAASDELVRLREADARWADTLFFEARRLMSARPVADVVRAAELFAAARDAFPRSLAVRMAFAETQHLLGEHAVALAGFDDVLRSEPTHRDAWLGRVTSLSHLGRHHDAIAAASRLLELGVWHVGDAHYWRAWNRYHVYELDRAWADVEQATRLMVNTSVYTLAGVIAYARRELATSIDRLDHALQLDAGNCDAAWTAGLVHVDQEAWARAGDRFSHAMRCLTMAAAEARRDITALDATGDTPVTRRRRAAAQKRAEGSEHRAAQSAFNAAQSFLRLGQKDRALAHLSEAAAHPLLKEKAVALRQSIEKVP